MAMRIDTVTPRGGSAGTPVVVRGGGFGIVPGRVVLDPLGAAITAAPTVWIDDRVEFLVPAGLQRDRFLTLYIERAGASDGAPIPFWVPIAQGDTEILDYQYPTYDAGVELDDANADNPRKAQAADFNRQLDLSLALEAAIGGGAGAGGGWVMIRDIAPAAGGAVGSKTYQTAENDILLSAVSDTLNIVVIVNATGPKVTVNGIVAELTKVAGESYYEGIVPISILGSGNVTVIQILPSGANGASMSCALTVQPGPVVLTCTFAGGYPGAQTELRAGDTFQLVGTTDTPADLIEIQDFGACDFAAVAVAAGTSFSIVGTIADRGIVVQDLAARVRARNPATAFGPTFDTDATGSVDGVNTVQCNNVYPSFNDLGTVFPGARTAFKGFESGTQNTEVLDFDTLVYSSPHGDFSVASPAAYAVFKPITCTNPGDYNDSAVNFRIVATRVANGTVNTFDKVIEVADTAPTVVVSQPAARLRSGGNVGTSAQDYLITATSDQNLVSAPDIAIPIGGSWLGSGFVGGPKVWTRTVQIHDNDAKGTAAWVYGSVPTNKAGIAASISGNQVNGGFVLRTMTVSAWPNREGAIGTQVSNTAKLECSNLSKGPSGSLDYTYSPTTADAANEYTVTQPTGVANPSGNLWYNKDLINALSNTLGFQQVELEEVV